MKSIKLDFKENKIEIILCFKDCRIQKVFFNFVFSKIIKISIEHFLKVILSLISALAKVFQIQFPKKGMIEWSCIYKKFIVSYALFES